MLVAGVLIVVVGLQVGRSLANLLAGGGWVFVTRADIFSSLPAMVQGNAGAELAGNTALASPRLLWASMVGVEMLLGVCMAMAVKAGMDRWGPSRLQGMATRAEAEELLGRLRLRRHARVIRPDLHRSGLSPWVNARPRSRRAEPSGHAFREVEQ
jgi:hypothetical protein